MLGGETRNGVTDGIDGCRERERERETVGENSTRRVRPDRGWSDGRGGKRSNHDEMADRGWDPVCTKR